MPEWVTQLLLALLGAAWLTELVRGFFQRKKVKSATKLDEANAVQVISGATTVLLKPLTDRINELEAQLQKAENRVTEVVHQLEEATAENRRIVRENQQITKENQRVTTENRRLRLIVGGGTA